MTDKPFGDIPLEKRAQILERRLARAHAALADAETALEGRMHELDQANRDLRRRESELAERLDIESAKLLAAQRVGGFATIYAERGKPYQSSVQLNRILGVAEDVVIDPEYLISRIHPLDQARIGRSSVQFFEQMSAGTDHSFEHRIVRPDGEMRWLNWKLRKEVGSDGSFQSVSGSVRDITESRANQRAVRALQLRAERRVIELDRLSHTLAKSQAQTETALKARTDFLSYMAHQFRTPLNTLTGMMDLLSIEERSAEDGQKLAFAARAAERLGSLVNEVIDEAEGRSTDVTLFPNPADLEQLAQQTQDYWDRASSQSEDGGVLTIAIDGALPANAFVDASRLREALDSLVGYGLSAAGDVKLDMTWNDGLCISMIAGRLAADIDAQGEKKLAATEPQLRRAGLIVAAMQGDIEVSASPTATLRVSIPLQLHEADDAKETGFLRNKTGDQPTILIAEDTESNRYVITGFCERLGCRVETAVNGLEAVEAALSQQFDAILMDVQMPVMTGEEAVRHIRASDLPQSRTPVIGVTAHSLQAERDRLLASGMSACLAKPIQLAELRAALTTALTTGMMPRDGGNDTGSLFDLRRFREAFEALPVQFREKFLAAIREDLLNYGGKLEAAVAEKNTDAADRQAHALKGIAGNIGAIGLLAAIGAFREADAPLDGEPFVSLKQKIAATFDTCGDLFEAMIKDQ